MKTALFTGLFAAFSLSAAPMPYHLPEKMPEAVAPMGAEIFDAVQKQGAYLLGKVKPWKGDSSMKLLTKSGHTEHFIRPNTGSLLGFAFLYRFGGQDEALLNETIIPMMRYLVKTHREIPTDSGKSWYNQWQSAHWAYSLGKAGWWVWEELPAELQSGLQSVIRDEARRFYTAEPPHRLRNDTASEENAWNAQIFHIATLLMPDDPDAPRWRELFKKWVLSSYITPADLTSGHVVGGLPLASFKGANIHNDFTLENHHIVHPDYMAAFILSTQTAIDYRMTGRDVPPFLFFNIHPIYENLKFFSLPDGGFVYPSWQDWRLFRNPDWLLNHINIAVFQRDPDSLHWARICLETLRAMQARHPAGNIYGEHEFFFPSTQNDLIIYLAIAWQTLFYAQALPDAFTEKHGVKTYEEGKIILNKQPKWIHSVSYGNKIMFMPACNAKDRLFDSYAGSGIGTIWEAGNPKPLPVKLSSISLSTAASTFTLTLEVTHGSAVKGTYTLASTPDSLRVEETLQALRTCTISKRETALFGILNNPSWVYETGARTLRFDEAAPHEARALQGKTFDCTARTLTIDNRIRFECATPSRIRYAGSKKAANARVSDRLNLNFSDTPTTHAPGETISTLSYSVN